MIKLSTIKANPSNPRTIKDDKFKKLVQSIKDFPKMMALRPMVVDENNIVLGGNMRLKALQELGFKEIEGSWVKKASDLTADEIRRFIIADNVGFGEHDWDMLANEWDATELSGWGLDLPSFDTKIDGNEGELTDLSDKIKTEFKIEVVCKDEEQQEQTYNKLIEDGYECRLLTL